MKHRKNEPTKRWVAALSASALAAASVVTGAALTGGTASADSQSITFEPATGFAPGNPNGQEGWQRTGNYDLNIVANGSGAPAAFGDQSLQASNAISSSSFGDHTFSSPLAEEAGESDATSGGLSTGPRQPHFEAEWQFTSADPLGEQAGLQVVASPDRGDGARMGWIQMADTPTGLEVSTFGYQDRHGVGTAGNLLPGGCANNGASNPANLGDGFYSSTVRSGLSRSEVHTIRVTMDFLEGPRNDVVKIWVDGVLRHVDTSWEDYFRYCEETNASRTVDSLLFRPRGPASDTLGKGFLIDNISMESGPIPSQDSDGTWELYPEQSVTSTTDTVTTTQYQAKVRPPINADGSSNFPKRRGVIPVQFDLEKSTRTVVTETREVEPVRFESILSDSDEANDYSFLSFTPDGPLPFGDLESLIANYDYTQGNCGGGSLRWSVRVDTDGDPDTDNPPVWIYYGDVPNFTSCDDGDSQSGDNLIGSSDARFDLTNLGGPFYGTYAQTLAMVGDLNVTRASLVIDGGWFPTVGTGDDKVNLTGAEVDGATWVPEPAGTTETVISDTSTLPARTCDLPAAKLRFAKNDATPTGAVNEADSIQPKDTGAYYRQVDCKYIYNLDVSYLDPNLSTRGGTYRVWVNIDDSNIPNPAVFDLR